MPTRSLIGMQDVRPGDHIGWFYDTDEQCWNGIHAFLREGLQRGEKILYVVDAADPTAAFTYFLANGFDARPYLSTGQLKVLTVAESYLRRPKFNGEEMISLLAAETDRALSEGYAALRLKGEVSWLQYSPQNVDEFMRYEAKINDLFSSTQSLALCPYDRRNVRSAMLMEALNAHPIVAVGMELFANPHYIAPARLLRTEEAERARLSFAIDSLIERRRTAEIERFNAELERRVKERTAELEAANKELEAFSYSVSHDLRAPLRAILGFAEMLSQDYGTQLDAEAMRRLRVIVSNAQRMGKLIDGLLDFARLGRRALTFTYVEVQTLVGEVCDELREAADTPFPVIEIKALPAAWCDRELLRQVFVNLLSNAVKFSKSKPSPQIEVGGRSVGTENVYCVKDNGVGFDAAYKDKLFGVFQRLHSFDQFEGSGVGLAIVQRIVARHGGRAWAESRVGEGATFYFSLPRRIDLC